MNGRVARKLRREAKAFKGKVANKDKSYLNAIADGFTGNWLGYKSKTPAWRLKYQELKKTYYFSRAMA